MMFNSSSVGRIVGSLVSPMLHVPTARLISVDVFTNGANSQLDIYRTTLIGQVLTPVFKSSKLDINTWQTVKICLPDGEYRLAFLAQPEPNYFVAIDNVIKTNDSCRSTEVPMRQFTIN